MGQRFQWVTDPIFKINYKGGQWELFPNLPELDYVYLAKIDFELILFILNN